MNLHGCQCVTVSYFAFTYLRKLCVKGGEGDGDGDRTDAQFQYVLVVTNGRIYINTQRQFSDITPLST